VFPTKRCCLSVPAIERRVRWWRKRKRVETKREDSTPEWEVKIEGMEMSSHFKSFVTPITSLFICFFCSCLVDNGDLTSSLCKVSCIRYHRSSYSWDLEKVKYKILQHLLHAITRLSSE
jgi:hypothetical protein